MTSSVFFKFKSQKEPSRIEFDGTGISVFELKRDIIIKAGLGDGTEFDLAIYNEDNNEEYDDDTTIIPRSTSIIARRLPPMKAGAGRAARYMTGKMPVNAKNSSRKEASVSKSGPKPTPSAASTQAITSSMTEEERMAAMFAAQNEQWAAQQDEMSNQAPVFNRPGGKKGGPPVNVPDHEPPSGYICYRCGEKGHWIQVCPTNDDPNFDNKPRVKRTTGIPRSFLKTIEKPVALTNDGTMDDTKAPSGVMVNAEGEYVVAEPDKKSWEQFQAKTKSSAAAQKAAASGNKELQDRGLECPIDKRMFVDPMKTPCCDKTYCNDCITNALIESDFTCPGCQTDEVLIDNLKADDEMAEKIKAYVAEQKTKTEEEQQEKARSKSPESQKVDSKAGTPQLEDKKSTSKSRSATPASDGAAKSPELRASQKPASPGTTSNSKKRPADELLENPKIPKGPKAMQQQEAQRQASQPPLVNGMNPMGFPNMPFDMSQFGQNGYGMGNMNMMNPYMMPMMGMSNNMMNPMMGMNGFPPMNGFPNMNMGMPYGNGYGGNMGGMGMGMGGFGNNSNNNGYGGGAPQPGQFPNQQKTFSSGAKPSEEESAYFRAPVNQHRNRGYPKRQRPSDYREL